MIVKALLMGALAFGTGAGIGAARHATIAFHGMESNLAALTNPAVLESDAAFNACVKAVNAGVSQVQAAAQGQPAPATPAACPAEQVP